MTSRRTLYRRLAGWLMLGLMTLVVGEPLRVHACPMHDGAATMLLLGSGGDTAGDSAANAHAAHGGAHGTAVADGHALPDDGTASHHACQCVGACSTVVPVAAPSQVATAVGVVMVATAVAAPMVPIAVPGSSDVVLPFAIGPPATA